MIFFFMKIKCFLFLFLLIFIKNNEIINIPLNTKKNLSKEAEKENNSQKNLL